jgi:hypothetical protein
MRVVVAAGLLALLAASPAPAGAADSPAGALPDPAKPAKKIDARRDARLKAENATPAPRADGAEFLRRSRFSRSGP